MHKQHSHDIPSSNTLKHNVPVELTAEAASRLKPYGGVYYSKIDATASWTFLANVLLSAPC